ncbi:MAG: DciA family protein [Hyphomicrobiales bacterium]
MTGITRKPKPGARAIGTYVARALDPAARARGFATTALLSDWPAIVGRELAKFTMPDRVVWPRRREEAEVAAPIRGRRLEGATLVLRIEGPRAIEVQHRATQILERVNGYFGYRAVTEMRFLQAPIARAAPKRSPRKPPLPAYSLPKSAGIEDEGLARALSRLGAGAKARLTRA